jgi:UDP-N-acetylglucosamine--N-acetylmuramyl-(pentapeptide) pyrophosphoryl-undecaprenol N-acetylglucosamine transferase
MKRIVLVGGGSGGHFYPLIAVAEKLNDYRNQGLGLELYYFGPDSYNSEALRENNIQFVSCPSGKQRKYFSVSNFFDVFKLMYGFFVAITKLYFIYPDVVFSKGSYTSVPVTLAAFILRIPVVIHESDTRPGSANKFAAKFARYIAISFDDVAPYFPINKTALTGIPLRKKLLEKSNNPVAELGLPQDKPLLFVTGGSLGAERLNNLILESLDELLPYFVIFHQTGSQNETIVQNTAASLINDTTLLEHYFVKGTLTAHEMNLALSGATLIISRAGTGSIYEIAAKGKPSILIPIPEAVSHDQRSNAYAYARSGAATVLEEENIADGLLSAEISRIMGDSGVYQTMSTAAAAFIQNDAALRIAETLVGIAQEHE